MSRRLKVSAAQLGPIHRADSRKSVVKRLAEMLKEADSRDSKFVVFPELALTTFFPRWWMEDQAEVDRYFEAQMPSPETLPLFELARSKGIGFYLGYAELAEEEGRTRRFNTSILVGPDGRTIGKYRKIHLPGHSDHLPDAPFQHLDQPVHHALAAVGAMDGAELGGGDFQATGHERLLLWLVGPMRGTHLHHSKPREAWSGG